MNRKRTCITVMSLCLTICLAGCTSQSDLDAAYARGFEAGERATKAQMARSKMNYVYANEQTMQYHASNCSRKPKQTIEITEAEALANGYSPCKKCISSDEYSIGFWDAWDKAYDIGVDDGYYIGYADGCSDATQ